MTGQSGPDAAQLDVLLKIAAALEEARAWAAEMQLGAEGFDNTTSARVYAGIQEHLDHAVREIKQACEILRHRDNAY